MQEAKSKRSTKLKTQILDILRQHHLLTAPQIIEQLHKAGSLANKTSVYRNLEAFLEEGLICQQSFGENSFSYELQTNHHDHIQCNTCGKVEEVACQLSPNQDLNGFQVEHHHVTLFGICADCQ